jgi:sigma-B regulation protein RsbU (phosphoserine phosphatase)
VLVVDDNEVNRDMLARRLERHGCVVSCAENGIRALEKIAAEPFDLVLLDVMMPELDGEATLQRIKGNAARNLPVIMISALDDLERVVRCIEMGAEDYLPKPFDPTLLRARVGACLEKKALHDQEQRTHQALVESQKRLVTELADAADYVESLLPKPISGAVSAEWRFIPSTSLGGDAFGYHWIDPDHFAVYLLDVSGHGVGTALLSVSAINAIRSHSLPKTDFREPDQVLTGLNKAFEMDRQNNLYFTVWYGVYRPSTRQLHFGGAGHPAALLVPPAQANPSDAVELESSGLVIGMFDLAVYSSQRCHVPAGSRFFVFSDGAYEIDRPDGTMWTFGELAQHLSQPSDPRVKDLDRLVNLARNLHGRPDFDDDFSIVRLAFE